MIYINMGGGRLGNQMFIYAFARQLQNSNPKETVIYNFDEVHRTVFKSGFPNENYLQHFNTIGTNLQDSINYSVPQYIVWKIFNKYYPRNASFSNKNKYERRWGKIMEFFGLYSFSLGYYPFKLKKPWWVKNLIVNGCFECEKYFQGIEELLRKEFEPLMPLHDCNHQLMEAIKGNNSVAISIRRGDFISDRHIDTYYVCNQSYFEKAIELIKQKISNPVFIFFSNDIDWVKENIKVEGYDCYYESGHDEVWETLRLMSSCKHFIISNSTLHWWAQYLSTNPNKIVIAPSRWYNDDFKSALFQKSWVTIDV